MGWNSYPGPLILERSHITNPSFRGGTLYRTLSVEVEPYTGPLVLVWNSSHEPSVLGGGWNSICFCFQNVTNDVGPPDVSTSGSWSRSCEGRRTECGCICIENSGSLIRSGNRCSRASQQTLSLKVFHNILEITFSNFSDNNAVWEQ